MTVAIIDSGVANLTSVSAALKRLNVNAAITKDPAVIRKASHIILPGVGAASAAMHRLEVEKLSDVIRGLTQPVLGICLGMQILFSWSEEDEGCVCLGLISGQVKRLRPLNLPVPHMGWNKVKFCQSNPLLKNLADQSYFYFVHSYAASLGDYTQASCAYGGAFSSVVQHKNFFGCQFHPERSSTAGAQLLRNFLEL